MSARKGSTHAKVTAWQTGPEPTVIVALPVIGVSEGAQIRNGQYQLSKALIVGNYSVEIRAWKNTGKRVHGPYGETDERVNLLPKQYAKNARLRFTPADDPNHLDFHLTKDGIGNPRSDKGVR